MIRIGSRLAFCTLLALAAIGAAGPAQADTTLAAMIGNYKYQPNPITVNVGDVVIWTNNDQAPHDVTSTSGPTKLASPELNQNDQWGYKFTQPGAYSYYCTLHPDMRATLTVVAATASGSSTTITTPVSNLAKHTTTAAGTSTKTGTPAPGGTTTSVQATSSPSVSQPADAGAGSATAPVATTDTTATPTAQLASPAPASSSSSRRINPLLFLAAVAAGIVIFTVLVVSGPGRGSDDQR